MVEIAGGASFPVFFFDGFQETDVGFVLVSSSMEFKGFQLILSRKIGISPNQFSIYLAENKKSYTSSTENRRRVPVTGKFNFHDIVSKKDCFFLVVLKRSRRERRRKNNSNSEEEYYFFSTKKWSQTTKSKKNPPGNVMLLRRNNGVENKFISPMVNDRFGYNNRLMNFQVEREMYLLNRDLSDFSLGLDFNGQVKNHGVLGCELCLIAKETGTETGFHRCVNDAVTVGFRSAAGPISRPVKGSY